MGDDLTEGADRGKERIKTAVQGPVIIKKDGAD